MAKTVLQKEIERHRRAERRFLKKQFYKEPTKLDLFLADKVPEKLESTLNAAFAKAFHLIFSKGTWLISKTYSEDKLVEEFELAAEELEILGGSKQMRRFKRRAAVTGTAHTLVSAVAGLTMGIFGGMLPDIAVSCENIVNTVNAACDKPQYLIRSPVMIILIPFDILLPNIR